MTDQQDPVSPNEYVLRRILSDYCDPLLREPIQSQGFRPTKNDTDGISVFRALFVTPDRVASSGKNPKGYYVTRLRVSDILALGLTVIPNPKNEQLSGHALIPELSIGAYTKDKEVSKLLLYRLAILAGNEIVFAPEQS